MTAYYSFFIIFIIILVFLSNKNLFNSVICLLSLFVALVSLLFCFSDFIALLILLIYSGGFAILLLFTFFSINIQRTLVGSPKSDFFLLFLLIGLKCLISYSVLTELNPYIIQDFDSGILNPQFYSIKVLGYYMYIKLVDSLLIPLGFMLLMGMVWPIVLISKYLFLYFNF